MEVDLTQESDDGPMDDDDIRVEEVVPRRPTTATVTVASAAAAAAASIMDLNAIAAPAAAVSAPGLRVRHIAPAGSALQPNVQSYSGDTSPAGPGTPTAPQNLAVVVTPEAVSARLRRRHGGQASATSSTQTPSATAGHGNVPEYHHHHHHHHHHPHHHHHHHPLPCRLGQTRHAWPPPRLETWRLRQLQWRGWKDQLQGEKARWLRAGWATTRC